MRINNSSILKMASSQDLSVFQWRCSSSMFLQKNDNNKIEESIQIENELKYVVKSSTSRFFYKKKKRFFDIPLYISRIFGDNFNNVCVMCLFHHYFSSLWSWYLMAAVYSARLCVRLRTTRILRVVFLI
jgi:hypothetical protein